MLSKSIDASTSFLNWPAVEFWSSRHPFARLIAWNARLFFVRSPGSSIRQWAMHMLSIACISGKLLLFWRTFERFACHCQQVDMHISNIIHQMVLEHSVKMFGLTLVSYKALFSTKVSFKDDDDVPVTILCSWQWTGTCITTSTSECIAAGVSRRCRCSRNLSFKRRHKNISDRIFLFPRWCQKPSRHRVLHDALTKTYCILLIRGKYKILGCAAVVRIYTFLRWQALLGVAKQSSLMNLTKLGASTMLYAPQKQGLYVVVLGTRWNFWLAGRDLEFNEGERFQSL